MKPQAGLRVEESKIMIMTRPKPPHGRPAAVTVACHAGESDWHPGRRHGHAGGIVARAARPVVFCECWDGQRPGPACRPGSPGPADSVTVTATRAGQTT